MPHDVRIETYRGSRDKLRALFHRCRALAGHHPHRRAADGLERGDEALGVEVGAAAPDGAQRAHRGPAGRAGAPSARARRRRHCRAWSGLSSSWSSRLSVTRSSAPRHPVHIRGTTGLSPGGPQWGMPADVLVGRRLTVDALHSAIDAAMVGAG